MEREQIKNIILVILTLVIIYMFFVLAFHIQVENDLKTKEFCDYRYGKNNWTFVDITGTENATKSVGRFYLGQVWECQP